MLHAARRVFPGDPRYQLRADRLIEAIYGSLVQAPARYGEAVAAIRAIAERTGIAIGEIAPVPRVLIDMRPCLAVRSDGAQQLVIDTGELGIRDVAGAARALRALGL